MINWIMVVVFTVLLLLVYHLMRYVASHRDLFPNDER